MEEPEAAGHPLVSRVLVLNEPRIEESKAVNGPEDGIFEETAQMRNRVYMVCLTPSFRLVLAYQNLPSDCFPCPMQHRIW